MISVFVVLVILALVCAIASAATNKVPLWVAVVLLCVIELLRVLPLGR
jgi:hypothetical protein